jgi:cytochrome c
MLLIISIVSILLLGAMRASADSQMPDVAWKSKCMICHAIDRKLIGPAFGWVAHKYKDDKEKGRQAVINRIEKGGRGEWIEHTGGILMPPFEGSSTKAEREAMADFILSLKPIAPKKR